MEILYKYVTASRALTCIPEVGDGTLRATQPAALNDPFECAVAVAYAIPDASEENRVLAEALTQINESTPMTEEHVRNARQRYGSLFTRQLFAEQDSTNFSIVSFATDPQHPLMWAHYTTDGSGFAIGYDKSAIAKLAGANASAISGRTCPHPVARRARVAKLEFATVPVAEKRALASRERMALASAAKPTSRTAEEVWPRKPRAQHNQQG